MVYVFDVSDVSSV